MVVKSKVEGFDEFSSKLADIQGNKKLIILFSGSKDLEGKSWCPDCVAVEPVIEKVINTLSDDYEFLYVGVGDKTSWKDPKCIFRTDEQLKLRFIPTLLYWGRSKRLEEVQCQDEENIKMLFEED